MKRIFLSSIIFCLSIMYCAAQIDTEFWFAAPYITKHHDGKPVLLRFATFDTAATTVTISQPANLGSPINQTFTIQPNATKSIDLTPYIASILSPGSGIVETGPDHDVVYNYGLLITSDKPITVYYEILGNNSEIYVLKGKNALGTKFYTPFQNVWANLDPVLDYWQKTAYSGLQFVATENSTSVTVTPTDDILGKNPGDTVGPTRAQKSISFLLNRGQTYSVQAAFLMPASRHISGTLVESNKPISVTTKDDSPELGSEPAVPGAIDPAGFDLIGDQVVPVNVVGTEYVVALGQLGNLRTEDRLFIVPTEDGTTIQVNGTTLAGTYNAGSTVVYKMEGHLYAYVQTSTPSYVFHVTGFRNELAGTILPPIRCTGSRKVAITRSTKDNPTGDQLFYMNLLVREGGISGFKINGKSYPEIDQTHFEVISESPDDGKWYYAQIQIPESIIAVNENAIISNDLADFHLGALFGLTSSSARYGYFSDYAALELGPDITLCRDQSIELDAGIEKAPWVWSTGAKTEKIKITSATQPQDSMYYSVKVCNKFTDSVLVHYIPLPDTTLKVSGPLNFCPGGSVTLEALPGYKYQWKKGGVNLVNDTLRTFTTSEEGDYTVSIKDQNKLAKCERVSTTFPVRIYKLPDPVITGGPTAVCEGSSVALTATTTVPGKYNYQWYKDNVGIPFDTLSSLNVKLGGDYKVTVKNSLTECEFTSAPVTIKINPAPVLTLSPRGTATSCAGSSITLTAIGNGNFQWYKNNVKLIGETNGTYIASTEGTYKFILTSVDSPFCTTEDTVQVKFKGSDFASLPSVMDSICEGNTLVLTANPFNGTSVWYKDGVKLSESSNKLTVSDGGDYSVVVTVTDGTLIGTCIDTAFTTIKKNPNPANFNISSTGSCTGTSPVLTANNAEAGLSYQWFKNGLPIIGNDAKNLTVTKSGKYTVTASYPISGCFKPASDSIQINTTPSAPLSINGLDMVCKNALNQVYTVSPTTDGSKYIWTVDPDAKLISGQNTGSITINAGVNPSFIVTVTEMSPQGCPGITYTKTVNVNQTNVATIFPKDTSICNGGTILLSTTTKGNYQWYMDGSAVSGAVGDSYLASGSGEYYVVVSQEQCVFTSVPSTIGIDAPIAIKITVSADTVCEKTPVTLTASAKGGTGPYIFDWYKVGSNDILASNTNTITTTEGIGSAVYNVVLKDKFACSQSKMDTIVFVNTQNLVVPNLITPNPHGVKDSTYDIHGINNDNDVLYIHDETTKKGIYPGASFELFNKWGKRVYMDSDYDNNWGAEGINDGIYYYYLKTGCGNQEYKGWLQITNNQNRSN